MADLSSTSHIIGTDLLMESAKAANDAYVELIRRAWLPIFDQIEANTLSARALRLGQETAFTAREAARGMEEMVKVGASLAAAVEASRTFEEEFKEGILKGLRDPEGKINAALKAAIEKAERGPRRKRPGRR